MFREANELAYPTKHESFTNKPKPVLQLISQNTKLDDSGLLLKQQATTYNESNIPPIPLKYDTYYDPNHPDADWSGLVSSKYSGKKHSQNHISQKSGLTANEFGLVSNEETQEWSTKKQTNQQNKNISNIVIGGIDSVEDRFKTEYRRFDQKEPTARDQLTFEKRQKAVRMIADPAQAKSKNNSTSISNNGYQYNENISQYNNRDLAHSSDSTNKISNTNGQYRASNYATKSFISDIGSKISSKLIDKEPIRSRVSTESDSNYSRNRILLTDNYHAFPSGYTGARKS